MSSDEVRKRLETAFVQCRAPQTQDTFATFVGTVNADLARAGLTFIEGKLSYDAYVALMADRNRKYARVHTDAVFRTALASGDTDGDLIPDVLDACPATPELTPTDDRGCPVRVAPCPTSLGTCDASVRVQRAMDELKIMFNKACDNAPPPSTPSPLDWGRGRQGAPNTFGFNLLMMRVTNEPQDCEVFYEVEFRFTNGPSGAPPVIYANAIFSERESLMSDPRTVMLALSPPSPASARRSRGAWGTGSACRGACAR
jgi:hypothetical protein